MSVQTTEVAAVRDVRMVLPALVGWGACAVGISLRPSLWWALASFCLAVFISLAAWRLEQVSLAAIATPFLVVSAMVCAVSLGSLHREQPALYDSSNNEVLASVRLDQTYHPGSRSVRASLVALNGVVLDRGDVPIRLVGELSGERVSLGSSSTLNGYLRQGEPWEQYGWSLLVREESPQWSDPHPFLHATDKLRADFLVRSLEREGDAGELLPGLAIGDTTAVDPGLVDAMRITSLSHLVAVSGANCAIVVALVVGVVAALGGGLVIRMIAGIIALIGFVALVTPEPSIVRASVMASIVLIFLASSRPVRGIPVLGMTVLGLLALDPWLATDFAFVLSVLATGGILLLTGPLVAVFSTVMPKSLALIVALPVAAQVACQPVLILLNPIIPTWAVLANALAAPAAPVATILGMLACVMGPVIPGLSSALLWVAWLPAAYIAAIGRVLADTPLSSMPWPSGWWGALAIMVLGYSLVWLFVMRRPRPQWAVVSVSALSVTTIAIVVASFALPQVLIRSTIPRSWTIAQCDVGQGDALVVRSEGMLVMIDTGKDAEALKQCVDLLGITHIDLLVITHFDADHVGAWRVVAGMTENVWIGARPDERGDSFVEDFTRAGFTVSVVSEGDRLVLGSYDLAVLWPPLAPLSEPGNDSSIVLSLQPQEGCQDCVSALFLGDLGETPQQMLRGRHDFGVIDVVKVSHHGSADQNPDLYRSLRSAIALIGVGADNSYGHPAPSALTMVQETALVVRSDLQGTSTLHRNEAGDIVVWSERSSPSG